MGYDCVFMATGERIFVSWCICRLILKVDVGFIKKCFLVVKQGIRICNIKLKVLFSHNMIVISLNTRQLHHCLILSH